MPIGRPRRIFRPALMPSVRRGIGLMAVTAVLAAGTLAAATLVWRTTGSAESHPTAAVDVMVAAPPMQVAVVDGATLRLQDRVVRLLGVEPPMPGATCTASNGTEFDCGVAATNALAALVREQPVACRTRGQDDLGRPYGECEASGTDLNRAQVAAGWARADKAVPALQSAEAQARAERRGLWALARDASR